MNLKDIRILFSRLGCLNLYAKALAPNDNSKNQIYFGPGFSALNLFPNQGVVADWSNENPIYKAKLDFEWVNEQGGSARAPNAQLILYPQYPEVRFSGFLKGCSPAPRELHNRRLNGRVLFLGVTQDRRVLGYTSAGDSELSKEFFSHDPEPNLGLFIEIPLSITPTALEQRAALLAELCRIHRSGWITSKRLDAHGNILPCQAPNCGGYTLEAELGVRPNGRAEPDFLGYEVKQHSVNSFDNPNAGRITLMTPEPTGGFYRTKGPEAFIRRYGYPDKLNRSDRLNFGGIHRAEKRHPTTKLTLTLLGYNKIDNKIVDLSGRIALISDDGTEAASWDFPGLMKHWSRKHAHAVYVPSMSRTGPPLAFSFGNRVRLAQQPDFLCLLNSFSSGKTYYDPGLKLENASTQNKALKRRSQFRIESKDIPSIYSQIETIETCG